MSTNGDHAVITDADLCLQAPDIWPPRTGRDTAQNGTFFSQSLGPGGLRSHAQFAMNLIEIDMGQELIEQSIGKFDVADVVSGEESWQSLLPEVVATFDLSLGLRGRSVKEGHTVEVESGAQLSESFRGVGEEKGMIIDVERQRQAVGREDLREEIQMSQKVFSAIKACPQIVTGGIIEDVEEHLFIGLAGQPTMRRSIVLPECAQVAGLPALDWLRLGLETSIGCELVLDSPTTDAGPVGFEVEAAKQFAGGSAIGGRWLRRKELLEQLGDFRWPVWPVIAAGGARRPMLRMARGTGAKIISEEFVKATSGQAQFLGGLQGGEFLLAVIGQEVTN